MLRLGSGKNCSNFNPAKFYTVKGTDLDYDEMIAQGSLLGNPEPNKGTLYRVTHAAHTQTCAHAHKIISAYAHITFNIIIHLPGH